MWMWGGRYMYRSMLLWATCLTAMWLLLWHKYVTVTLWQCCTRIVQCPSLCLALFRIKSRKPSKVCKLTVSQINFHWKKASNEKKIFLPRQLNHPSLACGCRIYSPQLSRHSMLHDLQAQTIWQGNQGQNYYCFNTTLLKYIRVHLCLEESTVQWYLLSF